MRTIFVGLALLAASMATAAPRWLVRVVGSITALGHELTMDVTGKPTDPERIEEGYTYNGQYGWSSAGAMLETFFGPNMVTVNTLNVVDGVNNGGYYSAKSADYVRVYFYARQPNLHAKLTVNMGMLFEGGGADPVPYGEANSIFWGSGVNGRLLCDGSHAEQITRTMTSGWTPVMVDGQFYYQFFDDATATEDSWDTSTQFDVITPDKPSRSGRFATQFQLRLDPILGNIKPRS